MNVPKRVLTLLTITLAIGANNANISNADTVSANLVGQGRWETAIKISSDGWKSASEAVIVNESSIPDALSATPFAQAKNAPILLTQNNKLDSRTKSELKRLGVKKVYLIGGSAVLSQDVEKQIKAEGITTDRVSGSDRYETSLELAKRLDNTKRISEIAVVNGDKGLADAVSVGAPAAQNNMPVILAHPTEGTKVANNFIKSKSIKKSYVIGGEAVVSKSIENSLPNAKRIGGATRNDTNAKVVEEFYKSSSLKNVYVAKDGMKNRDQLIDALSVGVLAAKNESPVIIVGSKLADSQRNLLKTKSVEKITQVGGNGNEAAFDELKKNQIASTKEVKTVKELKDAVSNAKANDVIDFKPTSTIDEKFTIETNSAITVKLNGKFTKTITIDMPNGDVINNATVEDIIIEDVKNGTFVNNGTISAMTVKDANGCKIENGKDGKIINVEIVKGAKNVDFKNKGTVDKIDNDSSSTDIDNKGKIEKVTGDREPSISGTKPYKNTSGSSSSSSGGGGGSSSSSTKSYTLTFDVDGGSAVSKNTVKSGEKITLPTAPTKTESVFEGWYTDKACTIKFDASKGITSNTTIYAKWTAQAEAEKVKAATEEVNGLFTDESKKALKSEVNEEKIAGAEVLVNGLKNGEVKNNLIKEIGAARNLLKAQGEEKAEAEKVKAATEEVNGLFT
ncbi:hemagglutinin, partial [Romboutsia maritimum]